MPKQKKINKKLLLLIGVPIVCLAGFFVVSGNTQAAVGINQQLNFQGRLLDSTGAVIADGLYNMEFEVVQDGDGCNPTSGTYPCSGTVEWSEEHKQSNRVTVKNGYFSVQLGSITAFGSSVDWNQDTLWVSINVGGTANTATPTYDGEMKPLKRLTATPYALNSQNLGGLSATNFVQLAQGLQTDASSSNASIAINKTGGTANILTLQKAGSSVLTIANAGAATFQNQTDSTTAFQIQDAAGTSNLFIADTDNSIIKIGTNGSPTQAGTLLLAASGEFTGALRIGDGTDNAQFDSSSSELVFSGTARHTRRVNLIPEFPGATMTADGSSNSGTMTSDFCSDNDLLNINAAVCPTNGDEHNYYQWVTTSQNDYDIYIRYQMPSDFSAFASDSTINMYGWRTDSTATTEVQLSLFEGATQCGSTTNVATGTATWSEVALSGSETGCSIAAGDIVIWRIRLVANNKTVRAGEIRFDYLSKW